MISHSQLVAQFATAGSEPAPETQPLSERLQKVLDGSFATYRDAARDFISRPDMAPVPADLPKDEYRAQTLDRVRQMIKAGFSRLPYSKEHGGDGQPTASVVVCETIAHADMSLAIKQGVQFGLFGSSIERLGTEKHQNLIPDVISGKLLGGFAMTEMSCGSDVQGTQTEALYDHATRSFTINTPNEEARKTYIGNAALHGRLMVVFAQLKMSPDGESQGVHAFLVPVRDEKGATLPGVDIGDNGHKIGLNGVDNGTLAFRNVKVPYDALLDRFGGITDEGVYKSDIPKKTARFFKMIGTLVTGRVFISTAALSGSKTALASAVGVAENRTVFGETLMDKQATQSRLLPKIAEAYALHFATRDLISAMEEQRPELETMAAALKAYSSDKAMATVDEARLLGGGAGYMSLHRYGVLRNDMDIFRTFEGDNTVLRLLVAKNQLTQLAGKFRTASKAVQLVKSLSMNRKDVAARLHSAGIQQDDLLNPTAQALIFANRERSMMHQLSRKFVKLSKGGKSDDAANRTQDDMIAYADAYAQRLLMERFTAAVEAQKDPQVKSLLKDLCDLYAVSTLRSNADWYLENGHMKRGTAKDLRELEHRLGEKLRPHAKTLVDAFAIPAHLLAGYQPDARQTPQAKPDIR